MPQKLTLRSREPESLTAGEVIVSLPRLSDRRAALWRLDSPRGSHDSRRADTSAHYKNRPRFHSVRILFVHRASFAADDQFHDESSPPCGAESRLRLERGLRREWGH